MKKHARTRDTAEPNYYVCIADPKLNKPNSAFIQPAIDRHTVISSKDWAVCRGGGANHHTHTDRHLAARPPSTPLIIRSTTACYIQDPLGARNATIYTPETSSDRIMNNTPTKLTHIKWIPSFYSYHTYNKYISNMSPTSL